jgi:hypothetical protein
MGIAREFTGVSSHDFMCFCMPETRIPWIMQIRVATIAACGLSRTIATRPKLLRHGLCFRGSVGRRVVSQVQNLGGHLSPPKCLN